MRSHLKDIFHFSRRDRNGILILLILICTVLVFRYSGLLSAFKKPVSTEDFNKQILIYNDSLQASKNNEKAANISKRQNIQNHLPEKIKKIDATSNKNYDIQNKKIKLLIDINSADSTELEILYGIGSVLSKRIIKYRNLLGGFLYKEQLLEVYGFNRDLLTKINENIEVDTSKIKKINICKLKEEQLFRHPYLSKYDAKAIIAFNEFKNGRILKVDELKENKVLSDSIYNKIYKYMSIN